MLPCRRGALLAKSASFKNIPEDIEIKHEIHTKIDPKAIQKTIKNQSQKWYRKTLKNITKKITNFAILGSHFGPILETFWSLCLRWRVFVEDLFSGTFAGHPQERFWTPKWSKREPKEAKMGPERIPKWCKITSPPNFFLTHCSVNYASKRLEESWRPTFLTHCSAKLFKELGCGVGGKCTVLDTTLTGVTPTLDHSNWLAQCGLALQLGYIYIYIYIYTYVFYFLEQIYIYIYIYIYNIINNK